MELRDVRAFVAVIDTGGFTRAAERLNVVQSAVSHAVRRLERELRVSLLERGPRGVRLTASGTDLLPHFRSVLIAVERVQQEAEAHRGLAKGRVEVGIIPTAVPLFLSQLLKAATSRFPGVQLAVTEDETARLTRGVSEGRLDLALVMLPADLERLVAIELGTVDLAVATASEHPLAQRASVALSELAAEPWVSWTQSNPGRHWLDEACRMAGFAPLVAHEIVTVAQLKAFVMAGRGIAMLPAAAALAEAAAGQLSLIPLAPPAPVTKVAYAFDPGRSSPAVNAIRSLLEELTPVSQPRQRGI